MNRRRLLIATGMVFFAVVGYLILIQFFQLERVLARGAVLQKRQDQTPYGANLTGPQFGDRDLKVIASIEGLEQLTMRESQLTDQGLSELLKLKQIHTLDFSGTKITDQGLKVIAQIPNLKSLMLNDCQQITAIGLKELTSCDKLLTLWIERTSVDYEGYVQLQNALPDARIMIDANSLVGLHLNDPVQASWVGAQDSIRIVRRTDIEDSEWDEGVDAEFQSKLVECELVTHFELPKIEFRSELLDWLEKCKNLRHLSLNSPITQELVTTIGNLDQLEWLWLGPISHFKSDDDFKQQIDFSKLPISLKRLTIYNKGVSNSFHGLAALKNLESLDLGNRGLRDEDIQFLREIGTLRYVGLYKNQLTSETIRLLKELPNLENAALTDNDIEQSEYDELLNLLRARRESREANQSP